MSEAITMRPIGVIESCFGEKFATPRQSGLVPSARGRVVFSEEVDRQACRGLDAFSHVWLVFLFDQVAESDVRWLVRPPRLGGNEKMGVFATRSPFRPNRIGLSLVRLERGTAGELEVSGLDLVDGTPVLDVKPYLPYVESVADAKSGFAQKAPPALPVIFPDRLKEGLEQRFVDLVVEVLGADPRPAYHDDPTREYGCRLDGREVRWSADEAEVTVLSVSAAH